MFADVEKLVIHLDKAAHVPEVFDERWARRPPRGQGQGARYIDTFKPALCQMFEEGSEKKNIDV
jgi:hypothetical protein